MRTLIIFFSLLSSAVFAQTTRTVLTGRVRDAQGAALPGVTVTLTYETTGTVYGCATNAAGGYLVPGVMPGGPYRLEIKRIGLQKYQRPGLYFKLDEPMVIDVVLNEEILILADVRVGATKKDSLDKSFIGAGAFNIGARKMMLLPTIKRGLPDFIRLTPQAFGSAIAGGNYRQNFITIDGSEFNNNFGVGDNLPGNGAQPISLDAIAEISINNAPYNAIWESGFIGSALNILSRSGSNNTAGAVYSYFRGSRSYGYKVGGESIDKRPGSYSLLGARMGGAIIKNRLFYFLSIEQEKEVYQSQTFSAATGSQDYGSSPNIARPTVTELDAISSYLASHYGYLTGPYQGYNFTVAGNRFLARIDWNIARNNTLSIRYNQLISNKPELVNASRSPLTPFAASAGRRSLNALPFSNANFDTRSNFYSLAAEWNKRLSNTLSNTMRASYTHQNEYRTSESQLFPFVDIMKDGLPFTSFGYEPFSLNNKRAVTLLSLTDIIHWKPGKNSWDFGFQADYMNTSNSYMPFGTGYYTFSSWDDFVSGKKPVDYALTYTTEGKDTSPSYTFDYLNYSAFLQHTVNLGSNIVINIGLRGDISAYTKPLPDNKALSQLVFSNGQQVNTALLPRPALLLSPRIAFKYDLFGDNGYVLKAGTGIFTGRIPFVWVISQARYSGVGQISQTWQGQSNTPTVFDPDYHQPALRKGSDVLPSVSSILSNDFKMPQSWKSSIGLDVVLPAGIQAKMELVYNNDIRGILFHDLNLVNPVPLNIPEYPDHRLVYPRANKDKFINPLNASGQRDPTGNSAMNVVSISNSSGGYYLSFMGSLNRKFKSGLDISIAYVRSRAKNYNDGDGDQTLSALNATPSVNGINNPALGYAGYVAPNRIVSSVTLPLKISRAITLNFGMVYQGSSEGRFSYTYSRDLIGDGTNRSLIYIPKNPAEITFSTLTVSTVNGNLNYSPEEQNRAFFSYIEQDKYLRSKMGEYAERNGALLPWRHQIDLRFSSTFGLNGKDKKHNLELSADIFNVGNLLNSSWGLKKLVNSSALLIPVNLDKVQPNGTVMPSFQLATVGGKLVNETFRNDYSINSTYLIQFGIRYTFD
ncbi:TonB-dependent receptor [Pedobacter miscanthi]|uniref:TonB-dependent receptor n=1 Tax=Pedobacter miscanthi TaxID=2259170 RepID=UPI002931E0F4|nr:carboxypeptidase regulatory-like domain-containing protein [Pedobacter miscanthi]